jgi:AraC family transcriptional regulator
MTPSAVARTFSLLKNPMIPRIETLAPKKLIGKQMTMTLTENKTPVLWRSFMPRRGEIKNRIGTDLYSVQVYGSPADLQHFDAHTPFERWAAVEVTDLAGIPEGMEAFPLAGGLYAVFLYRGTPETFSQTWQYIFFNWLPQSEYELDNRAHFELLGAKYKHNDPESEEEIWIPIRPKA